jgi:crotonobetainyl-CoA:carnitine CoA-transferase CaiB-like acyl-CoA transferase
MGALDGVRVVDLSRVLAGPLCTQILSDHGADVVKIEPPAGDETRTFGPPFDGNGDAAYFAALNRGKRALPLDLGKPEGRTVLLRLLENADVLVENFLPGTMRRWELDYATLAPRLPRLVYASISGFGADGPFGALPGYDAVLQAMCGLMSVNGDEQSGTMRVGVPIVDHLTGYVALSGILMALVAREKTGQGQHVEATLFDTGLSLLVPHAANWFRSGRAPRLLGSAHPNICPYDKFHARDGEIFLAVANDGQFRKLCDELGRGDLAADARFATNQRRVEHRAELRVELERLLSQHEAETLCRRLMRAGVPAGPVHDVPHAFTQEHARHRGSVVEDEDYRGIASPIRLSRSKPRPAKRPPRFAQHAEEVLREAGCSQEDVAQLRAKDVVREPRQR